MATPSGGVYAALYAKLGATSAVTALLATPPAGWTAAIFDENVPDKQKTPYIVIRKMANPVDRTFGRRAFDGLYWVAAVTAQLYPDQATDLDSAIDTALEGASLAVTGFTSIWCQREGEQSLNPTEGSQSFWLFGGLWRIEHEEA